jgi:hypothetical protein
MTRRIPEEFYTISMDWSLSVIMGDTTPPRDPDEDEEEEGGEEGDDEAEEPPVVREPDED